MKYQVWESDENTDPILDTDDATAAVLAFFKHALEALRDDNDERDGELLMEELPESLVLMIARPSSGPEPVAWLTGMTYDEVVALGPNGFVERGSRN